MDNALLKLINQYAGQYEWLDVFGKFFAETAIILMAVLVLSLWVMDFGVERKKNQYGVIMAIEAFILGRLMLTPLIHYFFPRLRPFAEGNSTLLILQSPLEPGFPSGHTVMAFAIALPILIYNKKAGLWLTFLAVLVSVSRVFVGVHYPSDILGGFVLALIVVLFINYFRRIFVAPVVALLRREKA